MADNTRSATFSRRRGSGRDGFKRRKHTKPAIRYTPFYQGFNKGRFFKAVRQYDKALSDVALNAQLNMQFDDLAIALAETFTALVNLKNCADFTLPLCELNCRRNAGEGTLRADAHQFECEHVSSIGADAKGMINILQDLLAPEFVRIPENECEDGVFRRGENILDRFGLTKKYVRSDMGALPAAFSDGVTMQSNGEEESSDSGSDAIEEDGNGGEDVPDTHSFRETLEMYIF